MKRLLSTIIFILLISFFAVNGYAATYYVDPAGSDAAVGTATETPWRTFDRSYLNLTTGDTLQMQNTTKTSRIRSMPITIATAGITISGPGYTSDDLLLKDNVYNAVNTSNRWMETWTTDSDLASWSESGTVAKEAVIKNNGLYSASLTSGSYVRLTYSGYAGAKIRFRVIYYNAEGATLRFTLRNTSSTNYMQSDGTWAATPAYFNLPASVGVWTEYVTTAAIEETTGANYRVDLTSSAAVSYVDGCTMEWSSVWAVHDGTTYVYNTHITSAITVPVMKGATDSVELEDYTKLTAAASLEAIAAGEYFHDTATGKVYYKLAAGESIANVNILWPRGSPVLTITADNTTLNDVYVSFGQKGIYISDGSGIALNRVKSLSNYANGFQLAGDSVAVCTGCWSKGNRSLGATHGEGFSVGGTASLTLDRCIAEKNDDDAMQPMETSTLIVKYSVGIVTGAGSVLEVSTASGGRIEAYNNTFYRNSATDEAVIRDKGDVDTVSIYRNNITVNPGSGQNVTIDTVDRAAGAGSLTTQTNIYYGSGKTTEYTATNADPLFVNAATGDFSLQAASPAKATGTAITGIHNGNYTDYTGRVFVPTTAGGNTISY
jgi:hypothetical protein